MDLVSSVPKGASALGHCGVQFRLTGDGSPQEMGHHRTHVVLALGHCGVQFRQVESALLWTQLCFSLGALWGSVQADEILSHQNLLGVTIRDIFCSVPTVRRWVTTGPMCFWLWDIVGFSSG